MTELKTFDFGAHGIRVVVIEDEPWFITRDVALALNIAVQEDGSVNTANVTRFVGTDEKQLLRRSTPRLTMDTVNELFRRKQPSLSAVSESGLYKLIMRSDKPEARKFQDWVTREVLPAIRKTGGYLLNEEARETAKADDRQGMPLPEEFAQVMQHLAEITAINKELVETNRKLVELLQSQPAPAPEVKDETPTLAREFIRTNRLGCSSSDLGWAATKYCNDRGIYFVEGSGNRSNRYPRWVLEIVAPGVFA
ncbi:BRO-N domain-containing protein [Pelagibacterium lentulum]|uniref:Bro-N domain-containing protein n=1 Tax=Pelagibacterium lentulum TaxID=2029865 RepID=A0A916RDH7_9HYPH|nr:BRO family protein [Pelagibacterium lentulum]GGA51814.1 hypothetical protein GCM10011499_22310 [Pelagibacterium lentulum]